MSSGPGNGVASRLNIMAKQKTLKELGEIMLKHNTREQLESAYKIDASDLVEVGRQALLFNDINRDGTLN